MLGWIESCSTHWKHTERKTTTRKRTIVHIGKYTQWFGSQAYVLFNSNIITCSWNKPLILWNLVSMFCAQLRLPTLANSTKFSLVFISWAWCDRYTGYHCRNQFDFKKVGHARDEGTNYCIDLNSINNENLTINSTNKVTFLTIQTGL